MTLNVDGIIFEDVEMIDYYVEYDMNGSPILLENHRWTLQEALDVLKRVDNCRLMDGRLIKCSHIIKDLENTLKDQREKKQ